MSEKIVIIGAARTPIGSFNGRLSSISAVELGSIAVSEAIKRSGVSPDSVDEVLMGMVLQSGAGQAPARQVAINSGLIDSVSATTINKVCGSGMKTVMIGSAEIALGRADIIVAGGMENMSRVPFGLLDARRGISMGDLSLKDLIIHDGLYDTFNNYHMGMAAELCAEKYSLGRELQDEYAALSYKKALLSTENGHFKGEIVPVEVMNPKTGRNIIDEDEEPGKVKYEKILHLKPSFKKNGTITAANASSISDGAAALVLASKKKANDLGLPVLARIVDWASFAGAPEWFTTAPVGAINQLLRRNNKKIEEIDLFEINEAFSVVVLAVNRLLGLDPKKVNTRGGAVSLGHPLGCSGSRIVVTLIHNMIHSKAKYGIGAICIGGGEATAILLERA